MRNDVRHAQLHLTIMSGIGMMNGMSAMISIYMSRVPRKKVAAL